MDSRLLFAICVLYGSYISQVRNYMSLFTFILSQVNIISPLFIVIAIKNRVKSDNLYSLALQQYIFLQFWTLDTSSWEWKGLERNLVIYYYYYSDLLESMRYMININTARYL